MPKQSTSFDFGNSTQPSSTFELFEYIIEDRGSKYSASFGRVEGRDDIKAFLKQLKSKKQYQKADHNSWAARIVHEGAVYETKVDDGEVGAGQVILRLMQTHNTTNCIIVVTRWFGDTKLMADRFKHLQTATKHALNQLN